MFQHLWVELTGNLGTWSGSGLIVAVACDESSALSDESIALLRAAGASGLGSFPRNSRTSVTSRSFDLDCFGKMARSSRMSTIFSEAGDSLTGYLEAPQNPAEAYDATKSSQYRLAWCKLSGRLPLSRRKSVKPLAAFLSHVASENVSIQLVSAKHSLSLCP